MAKHAQITTWQVRQIWKAADLKPHRLKTFKISNDPDFSDPASLRSDRWQLCRGLGGSLHVEWVADFSGMRNVGQNSMQIMGSGGSILGAI